MSTNEIAVRTDQAAVAVPDQAAQPGTDLRLWAEQATAAAQYAEVVCSTAMAPAQYRNKPAEATAAILAGAELGFSPMASLRAFHNIQGTPAPAALTLRAVVQAAGHEVRTIESTAERAVVDGRRKGDTEWQTSIWTFERASLLDNFKKNPNYKTNPAQMLVARATAEVCRWIASDAIMGMPYAAEEILDHPEMNAAPAPVARRLTVAELDAAPADGGERCTDVQRDRMAELWNDLGFAGDANHEQRLEITAKILRLPGLESETAITRAEAGKVIDALVERKTKQTATAQ